MQDLEFLKNINNKEILNEILHNSIDFLIGNKNEEQTLRLCQKYGFNSPDEFLLATRTISKHYQNACTENLSTEAELLVEFGSLVPNPELQKLIPPVLAARRTEIIRYLMRRHNAQDQPLVESFDWDLRFIMGDSSFAHNQRQLATCTFNCRNRNGKSTTLHFQMNKEKLNEFIFELEKAVEDIDVEIKNNVQ